MGILYSHIVFQPPSPPSYTDDSGIMTFRKMPQELDSDSESEHMNQSRRNSDSNWRVQHPIIYLKTSRGNTIPAAYFHHPNSYYTILFSHGNGEDLGVTASYVLQLSNSLKTSVLCYDYSGYGVATGKSSEANCYADIRAAYTYLISEKRIPPNRIVLFGRSLGSGPTVDLAVSLGSNLAGVVLIAALTSCVRVVFSNAPSTAKFDMFPNIDKLPHINAPLFCVHGMMDDVVPFSHGLELSRRARYPIEPLWIRGAGHNNLESSRFQYEVFLRYMKVLEEFRRWKRPAEEEAPIPNHNRRRDSFGAFGKVAGCFVPPREKPSNHERKQKATGGRRKKTAKGPSTSMGNLMLPRRLSSTHEEDLKMLWNADDDAQSLVTRRSSDATYGSRLGVDDGRDVAADSRSLPNIPTIVAM